MITKNKVIVLDVDGTICEIDKNKDYKDLEPIHKVVKTMRQYKADGWKIILHTSRNMNTYDGNIGLINANTSKILLNWLKTHDIPYDEIIFGKPWCGHNGFYVDDKAIRPNEFTDFTFEEIEEKISK